MESIRRFFKAPHQSFFLLGPRGTGKSTWTLGEFEDPLRIDLLDPETFRLYSAKPERLKEAVAASPQNQVFIIDEVQKIPSLLDVVHSVLEKDKGRKFVLTGSSARKLKKTGVDLLAGRALMKTLHPFMASELGSHFHFQKALKTGLIPLVWSGENQEEILRTYLSLYLKEEVQMEGLVRNLGGFSRFLEAVSFSQASVINTSNIARECQVERKVVEGYLQILEDLLLSFRIPVFTKKSKRELSSHPKFYFFDVGVFRSVRPKGPLDVTSDIDGLAVESLVAQHLRAWIGYRDRGEELFFWRTRSQVEVDFVIYGPDSFYAIEVKNSTRVRPEDLRGLISLQADYPQASCLFLYRGREKLKQKGILCLPCEDFLKNINPNQPLMR